jgi:hypothetical protein
MLSLPAIAYWLTYRRRRRIIARFALHLIIHIIAGRQAVIVVVVIVIVLGWIGLGWLGFCPSGSVGFFFFSASVVRWMDLLVDY